MVAWGASMPLVSVVVPAHNRPEMLAEALASVKAQSFSDYEIIVVSNGESAEMRNASCRAAAAHDARYFTLDEGNLPAARNFGIERADGEWIAFLDDDDVWLPCKLERQLAAARTFEADMIACDYVEFFPDGSEAIQRPRVPHGWTYTKASNHVEHWWAPPSCVLLRKTAVDSVGRFDRKQRNGEDNDLWRRVSWWHKIFQVDEVLARYRRGHQSMMRNRFRNLMYGLRHLIKMHLDTPRSLRSTLPRWDFTLWRIAEAMLPKFLHQPFRPDRMRRRWRIVQLVTQAFGRVVSPSAGSADAESAVSINHKHPPWIMHRILRLRPCKMAVAAASGPVARWRR